jgi:hypothetical protein
MLSILYILLDMVAARTQMLQHEKLTTSNLYSLVVFFLDLIGLFYSLTCLSLVIYMLPTLCAKTSRLSLLFR